GVVFTVTVTAGTEAGQLREVSGGNLTNANVSTQTAALASIANIDGALQDVANYRADLGSVANRLSHTVDNLMSRSENTSAAKSRIQDTNFAAESANLAKAQVLQQAGTAMLAQANASTQNVLSLLK
ncbi:MAG: flagellin, partial [Gammaproteobacteria bacterium]|nr:flagellin [Gammaproteobacteria bacterium]